MSANEQEHAREWFNKADTDLTSATLLAGIPGPPETICFLAQQGAEKYLKGYLAWRGMRAQTQCVQRLSVVSVVPTVPGGGEDRGRAASVPDRVASERREVVWGGGGVKDYD